MRIRGWMGRADQSAKVRGMFVHPSQIMGILSRHAEVKKARLIVTNEDGRDQMALHCEADASDDGLAAQIGDTIQSVCKVRGDVVFADPGSLADDGMIIDDQREIE